MSMSTHVVGFRPKDAKFDQMFKVWEACKAAGVSPPEEVNEFFDYSQPDPNGVEVDLKKLGCVKHSVHNTTDRYDLHLNQLPKDIKILRFENSY
jgi:hypothetical protein